MSTRVTLGEVSERPTYGAIASGGDDFDGPLFVRQTDLKDGRIDWASVPRCDLSQSEAPKYRIECDDLLVARLGSVGRSARVRETRGAIYAGYLVRFRVDKKLADPAYVGFALRSPEWWAHVDAVRSGAVQPTLNAQQMAAFQFALPDLATQRRIAEVLGALDDKIAANAKLATAAEQLLAAMLSATGIDTDPLPGEAMALTDIIELNPRLRAPNEEEPVYVDMQRLPTSSMHIGTWTHRAAKGGARFQNGDTLLARITPCLENRKTGYVDFLDVGQVGLGSTEYIVMRCRPGRSSALAFFLRSATDFASSPSATWSARLGGNDWLHAIWRATS